MEQLILVFFGAVIGILASPMHDLLRRWLFGPRLRVVMPVHVVSVAREDYEEVYVRLRVLNSGRGTAKNCRGYLIGILLRESGGHCSATQYEDVLNLKWAYGDHDSGCDILPGVWQYLDVINAKSGRWNPVVKPQSQSPRYVDLGTPGRYSLVVAIAAENAACQQVTVEWNWDPEGIVT
jgi:hypothetical protein